MTHRPERVGDVVRHVLARLVSEELRDPRAGFVTITGVEMSPDLRHARVWISTLGADVDETLAALRRATPFLRRALGREARLRYTPELHFSFDASIAGGDRVERILERLGEERGPAEPSGGADPE